MDDLAILTPSFRGDLDLFADLHESVLANTAPTAVHYVVVPPSDAHLFRQYEGARCEVWTHRDLLPRRFLSVPHASGLTLNARHPWPPVRGWVTQQIMKLAGAAQIPVRAVLIMDSDAVLLRQVRIEDLVSEGRPWYFRRDDGVRAGMHRHLAWHNVARRLLGVRGSQTDPAPDYVSPIAVWDPGLVRALTAQIADTTGRPWIDAVGGELHVSEFMLYGVFMDEVLGGLPAFHGSLCHNYYERSPLSLAAARAFAEQTPPDVLGAMISSHSHTPRAVRLDAFRHCETIVEGGADPFDTAHALPWRTTWQRRCLDTAVLAAKMWALAPGL